MNVVVKGLAAAAISASLLGAAHAETTEINFGIISTESSQNLKTIWNPFLAAMEKETGLKVNAFFATDYAGVIEGMRFDKVQVAWFGNKSAMEAVDRSDGEVFAQTVDAEGNPGLLVAAARQCRQRHGEARGRAEVRRHAELRHRRSELDLGFPGSDHLHLRQERHRPEEVLQDGP